MPLFIESITSGTAMGSSRPLFVISTCLFFALARADVIGVFLEDANEQKDHSANGQDELVDLYDPVHRLNRFSFHKTLLEEHGSDVAHWIVLFCPAWYEPCQALQPVYRQLSAQWQGRLNNALLSSEVRFASVDCATEKALCNTQGVGMHYPTVAHYHAKKKVSQWRGKSFDTDEKRITSWLQKELGHINSDTNIDMESEATSASKAESQHQMPVDFLLIFAAIAGNAWFISRGGFGGEASADQKEIPDVASPLPSSSVMNTESEAKCMQRTLPQEWARDGSSLEL
jgi:hypothetical protein